MNVVESRRSRLLVVRAEHGEELPQSLARAMDEAEARAGTIQGTGVLESIELATVDPARGRVVRRIDAPVTLLGLSGSIATEDGATSIRLFATCVREGDLGLETFGGELVSARILSLDVVVTALDDLSLVRQADARTGLATLYASPRAGASALRPAAPVVVEATPARAPSPAPAQAAPPPPPEPAPPALASLVELPRPLHPTPPTRPTRAAIDSEVYPEAGDLVSHFHFGECEVISSDGERIRLRQDKDGRVREVALTMLKIEAPTVNPATGKRHFHLARKH